MKKRTLLTKLLSAALVAGLVFSAPNTALASVKTFPDVTQKMTSSLYWYKDIKDASKVLATEAQIKKLNKAIIAADGTNVTDLKKVSSTVDGKALNEALAASTKADIEYFGEKKYDVNGDQVTASYYNSMLTNTQSKDTSTHPVSYGIAVNRTVLRCFPTDKAILDDPGDNDFDNLYVTALRVNEPVVIQSVSADQKFYYAKSSCYTGWAPVEDIAVCSDRETWLDAWDHSGKELLVICGSKVRTEASNTDPDTADRLLTMGTTLEIVDKSDYPKLISNRTPYNNYVVYLPVRRADGSFDKQPALISQHYNVHEGYLPLTQKNVTDILFEKLGDTYGWGGMLESQDCSGYIRDVYSCFGLNLSRNTTWQTASPVKKYSLAGLSSEAKKQIIKNLPVGSSLFFPGHEMAYLGHVKDKYYVISSASSIMNPKKDGERQRTRCVAINTLDIKRANGNTWLESLTYATIPFAGTTNSLYNKSFVGKGFAKALDTTQLNKLSSKGKKLTVNWGATDETSAIEGYQIQYTSGDDFSTAKTIKVKKKERSYCTISGFTRGDTIKVRIRNYLTIDGKKYYSKWSKTKTHILR
ncbi:MAG: SH3 domain-containing protein [Lachnospiraceae bacterium]|nr:SH3 domain-containing protein [Lachnospiraceae bacterium]